MRLILESGLQTLKYDFFKESSVVTLMLKLVENEILSVYNLAHAFLNEDLPDPVKIETFK